MGEVGTLTQIDQNRGYYPNKIRLKQSMQTHSVSTNQRIAFHWHSIMTLNCDSEQQVPKKGH